MTRPTTPEERHGGVEPDAVGAALSIITTWNTQASLGDTRATAVGSGGPLHTTSHAAVPAMGIPREAARSFERCDLTPQIGVRPERMARSRSRDHSELKRDTVPYKGARRQVAS